VSRLRRLVLSATLLCAIALVGAQVIGCRQPGRRPEGIAVPFLINVREDFPAEFDCFRCSFYAGLWRPEAVTVSLSDQPAFVETFRALAFDWTCRTAMSWDGGNRIAVNALLEGMVREVDAGPDYELNCVDPPSDGLFVTLGAPSESEEGTSSDSGEGPLLVAYSTGAEGPGVVVGIRRGDGLAKTALQLPAGDWDPDSIVMPMFVGPDGQDVLVLVLAERKTAEGTPAPSAGAQGLLICRLGADGRQDWTEVDTAGASGLLDEIENQHHDGATRLGDRLFVDGERQVAAVDLATATLSPVQAINDTLDDLYPPPRGEDSLRVHVGAYGAYLLVHVHSDEMERCVLAFSGDHLAGRLQFTAGGLVPMDASGKSGQGLTWPWEARISGLMLPGLPWPY
jgi:hypothetical protein